MSKDKTHPKFIGKYGEEIEIFQIKERKNHDIMLIRGFGLNRTGRPVHIEFHASKTTGKKEGLYIIYERISKDGFGMDASKFKNDIMISNNPRYSFINATRYSRDPLSKFLLTPATFVKRDQIAQKTKDIRKLFSKSSVIDTIAKLIGEPPESKKTSHAIQAIKNAISKQQIEKEKE